MKVIVGMDHPKTKSNLERISEAVSVAKQEHFPQMEHVGKIFYMKRIKMDCEQSKYKILDAPSDFFSGMILIRNKMFFDHMSPRYEKALSKSISNTGDDETQ